MDFRILEDAMRDAFSLGVDSTHYMYCGDEDKEFWELFEKYKAQYETPAPLDGDRVAPDAGNVR